MQEDELEVINFFSKLSTLWNELDNYAKIPTCTRGVAEKIAKMMEDKKCTSF